jgi:hypothetical protein
MKDERIDEQNKKEEVDERQGGYWQRIPARKENRDIRKMR